MEVIKNRRYWTPEYRNEIRLMVRKLNGVIDSLNYKYWRYKNIAYMEHEFFYLAGLKQDLEDKILNYQKRINNHYIEIKRLETKLQEPTKYLISPIKLKRFYKNIENEISSNKRDILYLKDEIKRDINYINHINKRINEECSDLDRERIKRTKIKDDYKKQLIYEYNHLVKRLNLMCRNIAYPYVKIESPNAFHELQHVDYFMFKVTEEMEEIANQQ